ncbi:ferritin-like domain-containing protein [Catenovulum maritimum]|uniref:Iminophenyl-pyruvate dimer synthase domain-containing protein n=1 Tax=Catenovulum maritimum TaxID=1513271 RepID=A0A0J8GM00_9ALTE|nr:ferritin-like protein [Catenovulum maritimum]KMT63852.1 hypothetical protein XM47_17400 [Catenovulum maritimum]
MDQQITNQINQQKQAIFEKLQKAIQLELSTLPPYLTAYFSIHENTNKEAANLIRSVFMEEMLHLCLAGNVMVSIGGQVKLGKDNIPSYPCALEFKGREFEIDLAKFSADSIQTFRRIELPDDMPPLDKNTKATNEMKIGGYSIGEFYQSIISDLTELDKTCRQNGESLFSSDTSNQITETYFWRGGGKPIGVIDITTATTALEQIIDQGEGAAATLYDGDADEYGQAPDLAHFFKFSEIYYQRHYQADDNPLLPPTGDSMAVDFTAVYPVKANCKQSDFELNSDLAALNYQFNQNYSLMLQQIEEAFSGNPRVLYNAIMNGMHDLTPIARTMAKMPIDPSNPNLTGGPSFEWAEPILAK